MRRRDREITDKKLIEEFIAGEQILRIAFYDEGEIYIVPVNYGYTYTNGIYTFYFHGAKSGRKYDLSKREPLIGFEIDGNYKLLESEIACGYTANFQSVIGTGKIYLVEDKNEKIKGLDTIMMQTTHTTEWNYTDEMVEAVAVFRLDVKELTCKAK